MSKQTAKVSTRPSRSVKCDPEQLRDRRVAAGLMQKDLAFEAGLSTSAVSRAELGRGSSLETIRSIADVLDCEVTDLLPLRAGGRS